MRLIFFVLLFTQVFYANSQNVTIRGKAEASHIGKIIHLADYSDYITYNIINENSDTIDNNGYFELKFQTNYTKPILLSIENLIGKLYIQPNFVYGIKFPGEDSLTNHQPGTQTLVDLIVIGHDSTELNSLIIDYNNQYNDIFIKQQGKYLTPANIIALHDTFLLETNKRYAQISNRYFYQYRTYVFAGFLANTSKSKNILYKQFIENKSIQYHNFEYMEFFNTYFKGYLKAYASTKNGGNILNSINSYASYSDLKKQFSGDKLMTNDTLKELVLLKGLIEFYYSPEFDKKQVQSVIEQLYDNAIHPENKKIAFNILQNIYQLQPGANAPDFNVENKNGTIVNLHNNKGKYIYLNFFSTQSEISLREMKKIADLKKKFNDKVTFISVCLDDSVSYYKNYLKTNPKFDWQILYQTKYSDAKQHYNIKSLSGFFLISPQLQLALSPAPSPSEGIEYKFNALFNRKKKNTITGIR
jgi:cytochrome oxidase Cu insertion factor (SCO1/SenC/PrrC family)